MVIIAGCKMAFPFNSPNQPHSQDSSMQPNITLWPQVPPSVMPWTLDNRPQIVRFGETAAIKNDRWDVPIPLPRLRDCKFHKRKSDIDLNLKPAKMLLTEEKMSEQLRKIHISNNFDDEDLSDSLEPRESLLPILVLSKEVQSLPTFQEPLIPLLQKLEKPTRALVLWKPPSGSVTSQIMNDIRGDDDSDNSENGNSFKDPKATTIRGLPAPEPCSFATQQTYGFSTRSSSNDVQEMELEMGFPL